MLGSSGMRTARQKCLSTATHLAHCIRLARLSNGGVRYLHADPDSPPIWQPMRVKTPWIVALKESRETCVSDNPMSTTVQLDLTPKEIQDSSYRAVCDHMCWFFLWILNIVILYIMMRTDALFWHYFYVLFIFWVTGRKGWSQPKNLFLNISNSTYIFSKGKITFVQSVNWNLL